MKGEEHSSLLTEAGGRAVHLRKRMCTSGKWKGKAQASLLHSVTGYNPMKHVISGINALQLFRQTIINPTASRGQLTQLRKGKHIGGKEQWLKFLPHSLTPHIGCEEMGSVNSRPGRKFFIFKKWYSFVVSSGRLLYKQNWASCPVGSVFHLLCWNKK